ncbi:MAG TPA: phosphoribosylaminoimidazolesuccinocarboxamide synthase [Candidatus Paceibacterota bacterium]|nr:phosphoribosylaminoimidazolesuccinocarboxamide synthase [Candidatus Paceibacterota bacterium]
MSKTDQIRPMVIDLPLKYRGKTRDTYEAKWPDPNDKRRPPLLIVASDRISTHDVVHKSMIPKKGEVLNALTIFWIVDVLEKLGIAHHLIAYGKKIYDYVPKPDSDPKDVPLHHRAIVVKQLDIILVEFILRQFLCGGLWSKHYSKGLDPYGLSIPAGLPLMTNFGTLAKFAAPVFTPTKKSDEEHDPPLLSEATAREHPEALMLSRKVFDRGRQRLRTRGIELIDSKFEFGIDEDGQVVLADEVLTPDSSRFALLSDIKEGENPPWLDKQIARDWAEKHWGLNPKEPLVFPPLTISGIRNTYVDLFEQIVGMKLSQFQHERLDN